MNPFLLPPDALLKDTFRTAILPDVLDTASVGWASAHAFLITTHPCKPTTICNGSNHATFNQNPLDRNKTGMPECGR